MASMCWEASNKCLRSFTRRRRYSRSTVSDFIAPSRLILLCRPITLTSERVMEGVSAASRFGLRS